jgi:DNA mismatch repair protein MutL
VPQAPLFAHPTTHPIDGDSATDAARSPAGDAPVAPDVIVPPLMQLRRTWIGFERDDAWVLIDQHSAHERVLYEQFMQGMVHGNVAAQQLLFPLTLHFTPAEAEAFDEHRELFATLGFQAEAFGGHSVMISAVPSPHARFDAERCLRDTIASLVGDRLGSGLAKHERLAATVACKAAVKAGDLLAPSEMRALFIALSRTTLPAHDVHGRSTIVQVSWDELERRFGRR